MKLKPQTLRQILICCLLVVLTTLTASASATYDWSSDYVFVYNDGSQLKLAEGVTATFTESANTGATVTFTDLAVDGATSADTSITLTDANVTISSLDFQDKIVYSVSQPGGTQIFSSQQKPIAVYIDGTLRADGDGWLWSNNLLYITGASGSVQTYFTNPNVTAQAGYESSLAALLIAGTIPYIIFVVAITKFIQQRDGKVIITAIVVTTIVSLLLMAVTAILTQLITNPFSYVPP
jgi:hypothetical protein